MSDWDGEDEDEDVAAYLEQFDDSTMAYEQSLDPDAYDWRWDPREDRYEEMADAVGYHALDGIDDRPAWERGLTDPRCRRCERELELDVLGTCEICRRADGRCTWCGLDPVVYTSTESCRACYRHLDRVGAMERPWNDPRLRVTLLVAGFRRSDLRQRRRERPSPR